MSERLVLWALGAYAALLVAGTGLVTADRWHPVSADALGAHDAHVLAAWAVTLVVLLVTLGAIAAGEMRIALLAGSVLAAAAFAHASGPALAWDQLGVRSVATGADIRGAWAVFDDDVLFAVVGDASVTPGEYRASFVLHGAPLLVPLVVAGISLRRRRP